MPSSTFQIRGSTCRGASTPRYVPPSGFEPSRRFAPREPWQPYFRSQRSWASALQGFAPPGPSASLAEPVTSAALVARLRRLGGGLSRTVVVRPANLPSRLNVPGIRTRSHAVTHPEQAVSPPGLSPPWGSPSTERVVPTVDDHPPMSFPANADSSTSDRLPLPSLHPKVSTPTTPSSLPACAFDASGIADLRLRSACTNLQRSILGVAAQRRLAPPTYNVSLAVPTSAACAARTGITATAPTQRFLRSLPVSLGLAPSLLRSLPDSTPRRHGRASRAS